MAIKEVLVPFPYSFECRLEKFLTKKVNIKFIYLQIFYRSDECLESLLCCDRLLLLLLLLLLLYAFGHRSLLFVRADEASNG
jgi:hypothetical protein